jgi:hypothetical protein
MGLEQYPEQSPRSPGQPQPEGRDLGWWEVLSEDAQKLYICLIEERGDVDLLPIYAEEDEFNLDAAMDELRQLGWLDEGDPERVKSK